MVNVRIISYYQGVGEEQKATFLTETPQREIVTRTSLYKRLDLLNKLTEDSNVVQSLEMQTVTDKARDHLVDLSDLQIFDDDCTVRDLDLKDIFIQALSVERHYAGSEWCSTSTGAWVACDVYIFNLKHWREDMSRDLSFKFYLKFALDTLGNILLVCSCHDATY